MSLSVTYEAIATKNGALYKKNDLGAGWMTFSEVY